MGGPWVQVGPGPNGSSLTGTGAFGQNGSTTGTQGLYTIGPPATSPDYRVELAVKLTTTTDGSILVATRIQPGPGLEHYSVGWFGDLELFRHSGGTFTDIGDAPYTWLPGDTHRLALEVQGDQIRAYVDDVLMITATDAVITAAGFPGIATAGVSDNTGPTGTHGDNWLCRYLV